MLLDDVVENLHDDNIAEPTDEDLKADVVPNDLVEVSGSGVNTISGVSEVHDILDGEDLFKEPVDSLGATSGDDALAEGEPVDIDDALKEVGLKNND